MRQIGNSVLRTVYVTPAQRISTASQYFSGHHAKASSGFIASSITTPFVGLSKTSINSKRFYSTPVNLAGNSTSVTAPPKNNYTKDLSKYDDQASRNSAYFLIGAYSMVGAMTAKNIVTDYLQNLSASADVLAMARVEVSMASIPEGKNVVIKWRGKPVFIRHRTADEISEANSVNLNELIHKEADADRVKKPEWLVVIGVCTHLGCVPIGEAGEYGGWFCPCHGSHYDISGRIRKGPAPFNLEIPEYFLNEAEGTIVIG